MPTDKERLTKLEKQIDVLLEAKEKVDRQIEIRDEIDKFKSDQEKGLFKYLIEAFKLIVILAIIYTGGNKALDVPWVSSIFKTMGNK